MLVVVQEAPVDLILFDLQLVGMPMASNLRHLRKLLPEAKIVVMADSDDRATILALPWRWGERLCAEIGDDEPAAAGTRYHFV